jgi:NAD+ kinase
VCDRPDVPDNVTKKIALLANWEKQGVGALAEKLRYWAQQRGWVVVGNPEEPDTGSAPDSTATPFGTLSKDQLTDHYQDCSLMVTLGGDGTLLYGGQVAAPLSLPVLSVNLGSLGFHTQVGPETLIQALDTVAENRHRVEMRLMLESQVLSSQDQERHSGVLSVNDVVVARHAWGHMVNVRVWINEALATDITADGVIISTPTGSSAYNFAAQGPVLHPSLETVVMTAVCPHRMRLTPLVMPADSVIEIQARSRRPGERCVVLADGQQWADIGPKETLKISRAPVYLRLIVFEDDFYGKLRDKLRWGGLT